MIRIMFATFFTAATTRFRTETTDFTGQFGAARHGAGSNPANGGAIDVEADAAGHHFDILFGKASSGAVIAAISAVVARVNAALVFFV
jgi:hypothetical protein